MLKIYGKSDVGKTREINQDVYAFGDPIENGCFAIVCDGMGGTNGGEVASKMAIDVIKDQIEKLMQDKMTEDNVKNLLNSVISQANLEIYKKSKKDTSLSGMGTTVVAAIVVKNRYYIGYVGDSRGYLFSNKKMVPLTTDHSFVQMLVNEGKINEEEARNHPRRNEITRALGILKDIKVDFVSGLLKKDDKLLLCSDGLTALCTDKEIADVIKDEKGQSAVDRLIDLANNKGGRDNITLIIIE